MFSIELLMDRGRPLIQSGKYQAEICIGSFAERFPANAMTAPHVYAEAWRHSVYDMLNKKTGVFPTSFLEMRNDDASCWIGKIVEGQPTFINTIQKPNSVIYDGKNINISGGVMFDLFNQVGITKLRCSVTDLENFLEISTRKSE